VGESVTRPRDNREARFETIYNATKDDIAHYLLRRCDSAVDAADIAAETFSVVWRRMSDLPADNEIRPWVFGVARRVLANHRRSDDARSRLALRLQHSFDEAARTAGGRHPSADSVHRALAGLSVIDRELLTLVVWDGRSPSDAAIAVGISAGAARVRLHRARQRMRARLAENIEPTTPVECRGT
jgi:RNA polymerase sigma-70 factor (ECF subfamily)